MLKVYSDQICRLPEEEGNANLQDWIQFAPAFGSIHNFAVNASQIFIGYNIRFPIQMKILNGDLVCAVIILFSISLNWWSLIPEVIVCIILYIKNKWKQD